MVGRVFAAPWTPFPTLGLWSGISALQASELHLRISKPSWMADWVGWIETLVQISQFVEKMLAK